MLRSHPPPAERTPEAPRRRWWLRRPRLRPLQGATPRRALLRVGVDLRGRTLLGAHPRESPRPADENTTVLVDDFADKNIGVVLPDSGERYVSTPFFAPSA